MKNFRIPNNICSSKTFKYRIPNIFVHEEFPNTEYRIVFVHENVPELSEYSNNWIFFAEYLIFKYKYPDQ